MSSLFVVKNLSKEFYLKKGFLNLKKEPLVAVRNVSFQVDYEQTYGVVGESGSGKSTIAKMLVGIYRPSGGQVIYKGEQLSTDELRSSLDLKKEIQILFQDVGSALNPRKTIFKAIEEPLIIHFNLSKKERKSRINELLELVDLPPDYSDNYPTSLSGGQKQRVCIAQKLAVEPSLLLLDEPTSALDVSVQGKIIELLKELQTKFSMAYIFITHDLSLMRHVANETAVMYLGEICEKAPTKMLFSRPLHPYTRTLLSSIPVIYPEEEEAKPGDESMGGEIPSAIDRPEGCNFVSRCKRRDKELCGSDSPELIEIQDEHWVSCHFVNEIVEEFKMAT